MTVIERNSNNNNNLEMKCVMIGNQNNWKWQAMSRIIENGSQWAYETLYDTLQDPETIK